MDRYKKTSLKFDKNLGFGRNLRAAEINSSRALLRNSRFSMQRCLETEEEVEKKTQSRIPAFGKSVPKASLTREQMLQKWKEEKEAKRQIEAQNKKPTFKLGVSAPKSVPVFSPYNKTDATFSSMKSSRKISFNATNFSKGIKENCFKPPSIAKLQANNLTNKKTPVTKESQVKTINSKPTAKYLSNANVKKESQVKAINSKPTATYLSNSNVKKESQIKTIISKPPTTNISNSSVKKESQIKTINSKPPTTNVSNSNVKKIKPLSGIIKPSESKGLKKPEQVQPSLLGRIPNRVPESKIKPVSHQNSGRLLKVPSKLAVPIKSGIPNKRGLQPKQDIKINKKEEPSDSNITFRCNISHIEPVEEKSFAPKDFTFNLGAELSFSYLEEGPIALYNKLKAGEERTSTPKRKEIIEIQRQEAENAKEKTEEKCSEIEQVLDPQVTQNAIEVPLQQNTTTCSEKYNSKYTGAVTKLLIGNSISSIILKESGSDRSFDEKSEINCLVTKNSFEDKPLSANSQLENSVTNTQDGLSVIEESQNSSLAKPSVINIQEGLSVIKESQNSSLAKPSVINIQEGLSIIKESQNSSLAKPSIEGKGNEDDKFNTNPIMAKQETLEHNANICSTTLNNKKNISLENFLNRKPEKLNMEEKFICNDTNAFIVDEKSSVPSYEEKENVPVFETNHIIPKLVNSKNNTICSGTLVSNKSNTSLENLKEKEPVKKFEKQIVFEEMGTLAMAGTSSSSVNHFKVPVFEGDTGIVPKRRSSSRVSNMSLRGARRSDMPQLESIGESIESSSPCKTPPKPPKTPKSRKSTISKDFTPRRSSRLARNSVLDATENLFDVRLSLCGNSPDLPGNSSTCDASRITYDFDKLHLEQGVVQPPTPQQRVSTRINKKVSLLYTPPLKGRVSTLRKSIKGDLMSFSPES